MTILAYHNSLCLFKKECWQGFCNIWLDNDYVVGKLVIKLSVYFLTHPFTFVRCSVSSFVEFVGMSQSHTGRWRNIWILPLTLTPHLELFTDELGPTIRQKLTNYDWQFSNFHSQIIHLSNPQSETMEFSSLYWMHDLIQTHAILVYQLRNTRRKWQK